MEPPLMRWMKLRLLVGGLFMVAGTLKAAEPATFLTAIENYHILPRALAVAAAFYLPYLEILCGSCLVLRRWQTGALVLMGCLMLVFIVALASAWGRGLNIACGCFGEGGEPGRYGLALLRDLLLLAALCWLLFTERRGESGFPA